MLDGGRLSRLGDSRGRNVTVTTFANVFDLLTGNFSLPKSKSNYYKSTKRVVDDGALCE
jgi:hypothetical protein